jgi:hypothetical protein
MKKTLGSFWRDFALVRSARYVTTVGVLVVSGAAALAACSDLVAPNRPSYIKRTSADEECPSGFTPAQCQTMLNAINLLINSDDPMCQSMGYSAQQRFNWNQYVPDDTTTAYGYQYGGWPDWQTSDQNVYLGVTAFDPGELMNTMAHEESHFQGFEHSDTPGTPYENNAYTVGDTCAGIY